MAEDEYRYQQEAAEERRRREALPTSELKAELADLYEAELAEREAAHEAERLALYARINDRDNEAALLNHLLPVKKDSYEKMIEGGDSGRATIIDNAQKLRLAIMHAYWEQSPEFRWPASPKITTTLKRAIRNAVVKQFPRGAGEDNVDKILRTYLVALDNIIAYLTAHCAADGSISDALINAASKALIAKHGASIFYETVSICQAIKAHQSAQAT